ncbi:MAG: hypothetical protein P9M15_01780 [Candidatus Electryoneaceae bacterium]|nr:hypothetical protein [Candidatus Electryoneaceae bacterium]
MAKKKNNLPAEAPALPPDHPLNQIIPSHLQDKEYDEGWAFEQVNRYVAQGIESFAHAASILSWIGANTAKSRFLSVCEKHGIEPDVMAVASWAAADYYGLDKTGKRTSQRKHQKRLPLSEQIRFPLLDSDQTPDEDLEGVLKNTRRKVGRLETELEVEKRRLEQAEETNVQMHHRLTELEQAGEWKPTTSLQQRLKSDLEGQMSRVETLAAAISGIVLPDPVDHVLAGVVLDFIEGTEARVRAATGRLRLQLGSGDIDMIVRTEAEADISVTSFEEGIKLILTNSDNELSACHSCESQNPVDDDSHPTGRGGVRGGSKRTNTRQQRRLP